MYKSRVYPGSDFSLARDSGSESTPLLSSESRTSPEPAIFGDSETSDLDPNPAGHSFIYGSVDNGNCNTVLALSKRVFSSTRNSEILVSTMANPSSIINFDHEKNYKACNVNLMNENSDVKRAHEIDFKPGHLQFQPDFVQATCKDLKPKQNSLVTIFSIWNTIMGSSLLTMPWGITMAGLFPGIILNLLMSGICLYTAYRLVFAYTYHGDGANVEVLDLFRIYLGKWAEYTARIFSIAILLGATIAYWILMSNFLYNSVNFIYDDMAKRLTAKIGPSILNADLAQLHEESQKLLNNGADYLHLDVMDGHFVPNLTFGHPIVKCLRNKIKDAFFETHMMVSNPEQWIEPMADAGVDQYTFHVEPVKDVSLVCRKVKEAGMKVGIALKPGTPVDVVTDYADLADMILVMTVEPGFGGQKFMEPMLKKVAWLRENYPGLDIEVDGGVGPTTIEACAKAGANMIVSGTAVIGSTDQAKIIATLRDTVNCYLGQDKST